MMVEFTFDDGDDILDGRVEGQPSGTPLTVELVPQTSWGANLRDRLAPKDWNRLRREQYEKADHNCEICEGRGRRHPVECHEVWEYDDEKGIQTLKSLIALCPSCHRVKHIGRAFSVGLGGQAISHLARINGWSRTRAERYVDEAFHVWQRRSQREWTLDLSWLNDHGVVIP